MSELVKPWLDNIHPTLYKATLDELRAEIRNQAVLIACQEDVIEAAWEAKGLLAGSIQSSTHPHEQAHDSYLRPLTRPHEQAHDVLAKALASYGECGD